MEWQVMRRVLVAYSPPNVELFTKYVYQANDPR